MKIYKTCAVLGFCFILQTIFKLKTIGSKNEFRENWKDKCPSKQELKKESISTSNASLKMRPQLKIQNLRLLRLSYLIREEHSSFL